MKKSNKQKNRFPTKKEIVDALLADDPLKKGFEKYVAVVEHKKLSSKIGIVKGEILQNGKTIIKGKMTCPPIKDDESFDWNMLTVGESYFQAFSIDFKGQSLKSMITEGIKKSIKEGKLPYMRK